MVKRTKHEMGWGARLVGAGLVATIGYMGIGEALDRLPFHGRVPHIAVPAETKTKVSNELKKAIAQELQKTQEFQGDKKTYAIVAEREEKKEFYILGKHVGDNTDRGIISTTGSARGVVDFRGVNESTIEVSPDNTRVTIHVPHAQVVDVEASHQEGVMTIVHDQNIGCKLDRCHYVSDGELLQMADKKVGELVAADPQIIPEAENQAQAFLNSVINGVGRPLLKNVNPDPNYEPPHISVVLEFGNPVGEAAFPATQR
ncbi:MAG TPA: DUF4230 domain-containing protein [Candidatus Limnocylindrales bacterium]|nr:DUF4230 domain-containing protein [Candidatus Limnocylindrales bacterium]